MVGLHDDIRRDLFDWHPARFCEEFGKTALLIWIQVTHQNKSHPRVCGKMREQFAERFQSSRGCTYPYNREIAAWFHDRRYRLRCGWGGLAHGWQRIAGQSEYVCGVRSTSRILFANPSELIPTHPERQGNLRF